MTEKHFDLIVLGGGPGGYVAAIRAAQLGLKVVVVEKDNLGGICLNWGCIPTKSLLRSAEVVHLVGNAAAYGVNVESWSFDLKKIVERSRGVAKQLSTGIGHLLKKNKVTVVYGTGYLQSAGKVTVTEHEGAKQTLTAKHTIIATGARARELPTIQPDGKLVLTYREAMTLEVLPKSILVVGSGAIGIEFASFYNTLGVETTVVEVMDRILPVEDQEISAFALKQFVKQGIKVHTKTKVTKVVKSKESVDVTVEFGNNKTEVIRVDRVISAVGIVANSEDLGLESLGVKLDKGHIVTDAYSRTNVPGVYAIGDVTGAPWLAHKASHEAVVCVEKLAGRTDVHSIDKNNIPGCTYSYPQVASVGLSEDAAKQEGYDIKVGRFPFIGNGKAIALGEPEGLVKVIFDAKNGALLGAHMVGAEVTEMIQGYVIGKNVEITEEDFMNTIFPHPTLSEMMHESVLDAYGRAIHM